MEAYFLQNAAVIMPGKAATIKKKEYIVKKYFFSLVYKNIG